MADLGATFADAEITATEKELKAVYNKAYKDILQKQKDFNKKYAAKEAKKLKQLASGQITQEEFDAWKAGQVFQSKQWEDKKKQILNTLYNTNSIAADIVNGKTSNVFSFNANYTAYSLEHGAGVNFGFGLYDSATVKNLIKNDPQLLPEWKIDQPKDYTWNQKKLNRQINLGIIEGESLDKIANRLSESLVSQNFNKMRTFARTAMTGAQNAGRQIRLDEAKKLGINVKKEWMATLDAHTRMTHRKLDGQKVDTDKSFDINGMSIRFPGDPLAPAALVYNCRCTMVGDLVNYPSTYDRYDNIDGKRIKNMTYREWEEAKKKSGEQDHIVINGKDLSTIWARRSDQFDFAIEDIINAQGFDGLPRVVDAKEFDRYVQESNFIAQRTYSAPDQKTLDAYRDQLYNGKWYVDCSINGADRGQGMYCAANYSTNTHGLSDEMKYYIDYNRDTHGYSFSRIETFTLDSSANIADYHTELDNFHNQRKAYRDSNLSKYIDEKVSEIAPESSQRQLKDLAKSSMGLSNDYISEWEVMHSNPALNTREFAQSWGEFMSDIHSKDYANEFEKGFKEISEFGTYCTAKGYDAIKAPGERGVDSYTVILNRTKVIFKGE